MISNELSDECFLNYPKLHRWLPRSTFFWQITLIINYHIRSSFSNHNGDLQQLVVEMVSQYEGCCLWEHIWCFKSIFWFLPDKFNLNISAKSKLLISSNRFHQSIHISNDIKLAFQSARCAPQNLIWILFSFAKTNRVQSTGEEGEDYLALFI